MNRIRQMRARLKFWRIPLVARILLRYWDIFSRTLTEHYPLIIQSQNLSCQPFFIISSGRSGTTLLRSMLAAGGQVAVPAETQILPSLPGIFLAYQSLGWENISRLIISSFESSHNFPLWGINLANAYIEVLNLPKSERSLARIIDEVYITYAAQKFPEAVLWGDQSPINTFSLSYIDQVFPRAKYIHLLRDGRDVVSSVITRMGDEHIFEAVHRWKTSIKRIEKFQKNITDGQYIEIRYEKLVREPEISLQRICEFLNIEYTSDMLDYWKLPSTIEHKFYSHHKNLEKPVFTTSIGKWQDRLTVEQQEYVNNNIWKELEALGYK